MSHDLEKRKKEISVLVDEINAARKALDMKGFTGLDEEDRMEAMDILNRIERRMLANMPPKQAAE